MEKVRIELQRDMNHIYGYSKFDYIQKESVTVMNKLTEWSHSNKNCRIYTHEVRIQQENVSTTNFHTVTNDPSLKIPYCELVTYLDIYYQ